jgi:hypothetical protein
MTLAIRIGVETVVGAASGLATRGWEKATTSGHVAIWVNLPHIS